VSATWTSGLARLITDEHDGVLDIAFDEGQLPRRDYAPYYGGDGSVGTHAIMVEPLFS
jgi:hypothetical protein